MTPPAGRQRDEQPGKRAASTSPEAQSKPKDARIITESCQDISSHDAPNDSNLASTEETANNSDSDSELSKNPRVQDIGDFVDNQVFSPKTGAITFNFQQASRRHSLHSLNL